MSERYAAFLSYAHRYRPWVEALQKNLEVFITAAGRSEKIFLDTTDLGSGRSWVGQLQVGLGRAEQLILVVTPEALASSWVANEWQSFAATRSDWHEGRLHLVKLVETPLPPFLSQIQYVDFEAAGESGYYPAVQRLAAGLLGKTGRVDGAPLPTGLVPAPPVELGLPRDLRNRLIDWLAPILDKRVNRFALCPRLGFPPERLAAQPDCLSAASAAVVWATGDEAPVTAAVRIVDTVEEILGDDEPDWIAALAPLRRDLQSLQRKTPEDGLLAVWLRQVAGDHERLVPYFQREAEAALLEQVYVELALDAEPRLTAAEPEAPRLAGPLDLWQILTLDRTGRPWIIGRWVVLGDPGAGKTTLLRHLAATLAGQADRPWVPLFESLPRLLREGLSLLDRVVRRLEMAGLPTRGLKPVLEREGQQGRLLLLLDGLDEVPRDDQERARELLRDLAALWPDSPIVVTSRRIGYSRLGSDYRELALVPLDRARREDFLARWLGRTTRTKDFARAKEAMGALDGPDLRELAGNPLYLTLMALLFERGEAPEKNRARLYDQVFDLLLKGGHRLPQTPIDHPPAVRQALAYLGCSMTVDNRDAEPLDQLQARLYEPEASAVYAPLERVPRWRHGLQQFFDDVAEKTGILGPHDGRDADWRFWHRTFREALAAESLAEEYRGREGKAALLARAKSMTAEEDLSRWAEPFALLAGRMEDPDGLVRALIAENRPLGLRALATAQNLRDDTLREVLTLTEKWEERQKVYTRVPELVGEPGRALRLLDQLRRRTRNGNDLFFLDQAVQEVGRRSPEHAQKASELRARLYNHIPVPPEELFRWIETPRDGRVELWREIPAGRFWMGSPKGEGYVYERPRHEVTIARPFRCAAVPVTQVQYAAFDDGRPVRESPLHPVIDATWFEAVSFCRWLSALFPWTRGARLPVEEEWEYACRAGTESRYWSGNKVKDLTRVGWYQANSGNRPHQVGQKPANPWGLYDVHGNVWEWTLSPWTKSYAGREGGVTHDPSSVEIEPAAAEAVGGGGLVFRGGCFWYVAGRARAACRVNWDPWFGVVGQGFRVALPLQAPSSLAVDLRS